MRLQLTVFSLFVLALFLAWQLSALFEGRKRRPATGPGRGGEPLPERMKMILTDSPFTYVPLAAIALLMLSYGKPELLPQWAGWAVVILQVLRSMAKGLRMRRIKTVIGLLALVCLFYLWISQLPFFDPFPA